LKSQYQQFPHVLIFNLCPVRTALAQIGSRAGPEILMKIGQRLLMTCRLVGPGGMNSWWRND